MLLYAMETGHSSPPPYAQSVRAILRRKFHRPVPLLAHHIPLLLPTTTPSSDVAKHSTQPILRAPPRRLDAPHRDTNAHPGQQIRGRDDKLGERQRGKERGGGGAQAAVGEHLEDGAVDEGGERPRAVGAHEVARAELVGEQDVVEAARAAAVQPQVVVAAEEEAAAEVLLRYGAGEGEVEGGGAGHGGGVDAGDVGFEVQRVAVRAAVVDQQGCVVEAGV